MTENAVAPTINYNGYAQIPFEQHVDEVKATQGECPVAHSAEQGGFWLISRYDDVREVLSTPETFSSRNGMALPRNPRRPPTPPIDQDGKRHRDFRKVINPYLSPAAVEAHADTIRQIARELIAGFLDKGHCDVVRDFSHPFTAMVVARTIFGLDAAYEQEMVAMRQLVADMGRDASEADSVAKAWLATHDFGRKIISDRHPDDPRDDLVASVKRGLVEGEPLALDQQAGVLAITMLGGIKTSASVLARIIETAIGAPDRETDLRDPVWVRSSIDEFLRLGPPIAWGGREVVQQVQVGGVTIEPGEQVMCHFAAANRDADEFADPDVFDADRTAANRHLGFGFGVHRCVGAHLARLEITIAVTEFMNTVSGLEWQPGTTGHYTKGQEWGPSSFPVTFRRA
jgi:cytochrome P450